MTPNTDTYHAVSDFLLDFSLENCWLYQNVPTYYQKMSIYQFINGEKTRLNKGRKFSGTSHDIVLIIPEFQ